MTFKKIEFAAIVKLAISMAAADGVLMRMKRKQLD